MEGVADALTGRVCPCSIIEATCHSIASRVRTVDTTWYRAVCAVCAVRALCAEVRAVSLACHVARTANISLYIHVSPMASSKIRDSSMNCRLSSGSAHLANGATGKRQAKGGSRIVWGNHGNVKQS